MKYRVLWTIDIEANSPWEAGLRAKLAQLDNDSIVARFVVADADDYYDVHVSGVDWRKRNEAGPLEKQLAKNRSEKRL